LIETWIIERYWQLATALYDFVFTARMSALLGAMTIGPVARIRRTDATLGILTQPERFNFGWNSHRSRVSVANRLATVGDEPIRWGFPKSDGFGDTPRAKKPPIFIAACYCRYDRRFRQRF